MKQLKLAENLVYLRRKHGVTQDVIADFLGVTKASVSKWENGLSMPDIMQLPRLASYYNITIDELMGYEAQLSMQEIKEYYKKFAADFAKYPFENVMVQIDDFLKQYYSCYPALVQIAMLLLNHYTLAEVPKQPQILEEIIELCRHIQEKSADVNVCADAAVLEAITELMRGNPEVTVKKLQSYQNPQSVHNTVEGILTQAYQMMGQTDNATEWNQVVIFNHLMNLVENSSLYLLANLGNKAVGIATIERVTAVIKAYELDRLHPNTYLKFQYAVAAFYSAQGMNDEALKALRKYVEDCVDFVKNTLYLHGDDYFDRLDNYFQKNDEYITMPRNKDTVLKSIVTDLENPLFAAISGTEEFQKIKVILNE